MQVLATGGQAVAIRRVGARPALARVDGRAVVSEGVLPGVDAVDVGSKNRLEELLVVREPRDSFAYDLELPAGWTLHAAAPRLGLVEVRDGNARARLRMRAAAAWDAAGSPLSLDVTAEGARVELHVQGAASWPVVVDPEWQDAGTMALPRSQHTSTLLGNGKVLIAGGDLGNIGTCELYDPESGTYSVTGTLTVPRFGHTATLLSDGRVLVVGGRPGVGSDAAANGSAEIYDPATGVFTSTGSLNQTRTEHTATRLPDGTVLVTGGQTNVAATILVNSNTAEIYDPKAGKFTLTAPMTQTRVGHTATALGNGQVLVVGGTDPGATGAPAELFDAKAGSFTNAALPVVARTGHTATVLPSGDILFVGGAAQGQAPAEIYSVKSAAFASTGAEPSDPNAPVATRNAHTATLLPSGKVMIAGGRSGTSETGVAAIELYDPATATFAQTGVAAADTMAEPSWRHTATLLPSGRVLMVGGESNGEILPNGRTYSIDALTTLGSRPMQDPRAFHGAVTLPSGKVLVMGGLDKTTLTPTTTAEIYDPATDAYSPTGSLVQGRYAFATALLPSGMVLVAGGTDVGGNPMASAEIYDPASGTFTAVAPMVAGRQFFTATVLKTGSVLLVGGHENPAQCTAEIFTPNAANPHTGTFACTTNALAAKLRKFHTATLLTSGKVLVAGGWLAQSNAPPFNDAEVFDPTNQSFTPCANLMTTRRFIHTATLLPSGQVLLAGGRPFDQNTVIQSTDSAEVYDPTAGTFTATAKPMNSKRAFASALLLPSGKVLVAGGGNEQFPGQPFFDAVATAELYDPAAQTFTPVGPLSEPRQYMTLTALPGGGALAVGGDAKGYQDRLSSQPIWTSDVFDPTSNTFHSAGGTLSIGAYPVVVTLPDNTLLVAGGLNDQQQAVASASVLDPANVLSLHSIGSMGAPRSNAAGVLLDGAGVLVTGGSSSNGAATSSAERFDVASRMFHAVASMKLARVGHTMTRMPSGQVLLVGGHDETGADVGPAELYDPTKDTFTQVGALAQPRWHHTAALLPSGAVLVAGGESVGQSTAPGMELYDPIKQTFAALQSPVVAGVSSSSALYSGDVFLAGDGVAMTYTWKTPGFDFFSGTVSNPFAVQTFLNADVVVCGAGQCDWLQAPLQKVGMTGTAYTTLDAAGSTALRLADTRLLVMSPTAHVGSYSVAYETTPAGVVRPVIQGASVHSVGSSLQLTITGSGFARSTAQGSSATSVDSSIVPIVAFMPEGGGGPVTSSLLGFSDTSIEWLVPTTTYHGPGRLHVIVNGVPSVGYFSMLPPAANGTACGFDSDCATGFCVAGADPSQGTVCCDSRCSGGCESCRARDQAPGQGVDGTCGPIAAETDPKNACIKTPQQACQQTGLCDGKGACECVACRSQLDCAADEVCAPDGRCEPFRQSPTPADPGCGVAAVGPGGDEGWLALGVGALAIAARRRRRYRTASSAPART